MPKENIFLLMQSLFLARCSAHDTRDRLAGVDATRASGWLLRLFALDLWYEYLQVIKVLTQCEQSLLFTIHKLLVATKLSIRGFSCAAGAAASLNFFGSNRNDHPWLFPWRCGWAFTEVYGGSHPISLGCYRSGARGLKLACDRWVFLEFMGKDCCRSLGWRTSGIASKWSLQDSALVW